uniref:Uncharacterized protein n=1 Tax=Moniliophthora roreri TaxID=221103 RepID=A0A0W0F1H6_MONRR
MPNPQILGRLTMDRHTELKKEGQLSVDDNIDSSLLELALGNRPNKHSALVCKLFLVEKCVKENHPKSVDAYSSALINYWDNLDPHGKYKGSYEYDENTGSVKGNPACAPAVQMLIKSIKNGLGGDKTTRNHAEAITYEDMVQWMMWSEGVMPNAHAYWTDWVCMTSSEQLLQVMKYLMMHVFASSGFTLWTRNSELCQLRRRHIRWNLSAPPEFPGLFYDEVNLTE